MAIRRLDRLYEAAVERLSFSGELYKLRRELNARIDLPEPPRPDARFHPLGVARWFKKRRISIAEAYLAVVRDLGSSHARSRLRALRSMMDASFHTQALDMPLNAARVQMALIKEAVKSRGDRRRQLELLGDFSVSSRGRERSIRRLLSELDLVELPEDGRRLEEMDAGFDTHVHDAGTSGRKNPTQLLIDAFIKGISRVGIAYGGSSSVSMMEEALEAGAILGIRVDIGIQAGLDFQGERFHITALLPRMRGSRELGRFFERNRHELKPLLEGLEEDQAKRLAAIERRMDAFNEGPLSSLNAGFPDRPAYKVPKLRMKDLAASVGLERARLEHLGDLLWRSYGPIALNRLLYLKVERGKAARDARRGLVGQDALEEIEGRYAAMREEYRKLSPDALRRRYFPEADHASAFDELPELRRMLDRAGCGLRLVRSLEHGLSRLQRLLDEGFGLFDEIEVYNIKDCLGRESAEIAALCRIVSERNEARARGGLAPCLPVVGSDSTERSPDLPGMGFIRADFLRGARGRAYAARHAALPEPVARLARSRGGAVGEAAPEGTRSRRPPDGRILCMGRAAAPAENRVGDEEDSPPAPIPLLRTLRYLNPTLSGLAISLVGFLVADLVIGPGYAILWLAITGSRNALADLIAVRGATLRQWSAKSVDWPNVAQSLLWTGFSVPIMAFIKSRFDLAWPALHQGLAYEAAKFFLISFANGLYIASHNLLRGFDKAVARANLFRTILSWPLATAASPLGNLLGVPSIVQSKLWSDVVGGIIEGSRKYVRTLRLRNRDVDEIVPRILASKKARRAIATFDLLYLFREEPRTRTSLKAALKDRPETAGELAAAFADPRLDSLLLDYALRRHGGDMAVDLAGLIASTLPEFRDWLEAVAAAPRKDRGPS